MENKILVGSTYFFGGYYSDFRAKDKDCVVVVDSPVGYNFVKQTSGKGLCIFYWKRLTPQEYIDYALLKGPPMQIGKFLVPEFCQEVEFTIEHLSQLLPLVELLDDKHKYEKDLYDSYILNGEFTLTEEQRNTCYESYKDARKKTKEEIS